jgi:hypothetical protein
MKAQVIRRLAPAITSMGVLVSVILIAAMSGCTTRFVDYTMLSTKNMDLSKAGTYTRAGNRVRGQDSQYWILFIPTAGNPNVKEATDRAIESVPGAVALVDGVVYSRGWWFLFGESSFIVEGLPLIDPSLPGARTSIEAERFVSFRNPRTKAMESRAVDKVTYDKVKELAQRHQDKALADLLLGLQ